MQDFASPWIYLTDIDFCDMKWLHNLLKGASLTTALFIFQACYGTPFNAMTEEVGYAPMSFVVRSGSTGEPLEGINVSCNGEGMQHSRGAEFPPHDEIGVTDKDGRCTLNLPYVRNIPGPGVRFEDPLGKYQPKDTLLLDLNYREITIKLNDSNL